MFCITVVAGLGVAAAIAFDDVLTHELSLGLTLFAGLNFIKELTYQKNERIE